MPPEELSKIVIKGIEGAVKSIISETIGKIPFVKEFALEKFNKFLPELHSKLLKGLKNGSIKKAMDDGSEAFYAKPNIYKALEAVSEQSFKSTMDFIDKKKEQIFPNITKGGIDGLKSGIAKAVGDEVKKVKEFLGFH